MKKISLEITHTRRIEASVREGRALTDIVRVDPTDSRRCVVVLVEDANDPVEKHLTLFGRETLDRFGVLAQSVDGLPSCHGVRPDDGLLVSEP